MQISLSTRTSPYLFAAGQWLQAHRRFIIGLQWVVILFYGFLIIVPTFLPLPTEKAHIWNNLTLAAQFVFWGIWWPFVLLSMVLMGRVWCGVLCPEGALTEWVSRYSLNRSIPKWMRWGGWPFIAFAGTTVYGQMVSVYQYPKAVLLVLGGSTVAAIAVGLVYTRERRIWCMHLCPVNGVFGLLAKLAPMHYKTDTKAWQQPHQTATPVCAPLLPLAKLDSSSACHGCGRCSGYRNAIALTPRSPSDEISRLGFQNATSWQSILLIFGMIGLAMGAFHWSSSPWFVIAKQAIAEWLINREVFWPFDTTAPWWLLTHYPENNDALSWLDGGVMLAYIGTTAVVLSALVSLPLWLAARKIGRPTLAYFNHLAQALIPLAGCGIFLGLSATTIAMLRAEHLPLFWVSPLRIALLCAASGWTLYLGIKIGQRHQLSSQKMLYAMSCLIIACLFVNAGWLLLFWIW